MQGRPELPLIGLMGPTGSGKTVLALALQAHLPVEIISVDSALVYRGLDIGTAKPTPAEQAIAPHRLIDICEPTENYSAGRFCRDALAAIQAIRKRGNIPLLVGGTGLYFRLLEQGFSTLPTTDAATRARLSAWMQQWGMHRAHARLAEIDPPSAARIHPNDPQRIQRALEVYVITGKPLSALLAAGRVAPLNACLVKFVLAPAERAVLHQAVAARFERMLAQGLLDEVHGFYRREDMHPGLNAMRLVGYRQVWQHLAGKSSYQTMRDQAIAATRQLIKRQLTWFRAEADTIWLAAGDTGIANKILSEINKYPAFSNTL